MNPKIKAQWLQALRSGDYEQGIGRLHTVDEDGTHRFCCIGVLCELAVAAGVIEPPELGIDDDTYSYGISVTAMPPGDVEEWADFDPFSTNLVDLNDNIGWTFEQIADFIEEHL